MTTYKKFSATDIDQIDPNEGIIIDVRTKMEHAEKKLSFGHTLVTLNELKPTDFMLRHGLDKDFGVYILCHSGMRASQAAEKFVAEGYNNVHIIEGGIVACEGSGHELEGHAANNNVSPLSKKGAISLERQVRIAAGVVIAFGAFLALVLNPLFSLVPLIAGAGLVFAGITNRCGMALILTKAPWNKVEAGSCSTTSCSVPTGKSNSKKVQTGQSCQ